LVQDFVRTSQHQFDDLKKFSDLEKRISKLPTEKERGDAFEVFAEAYLATQTIMQARKVWSFNNIPPSYKRKFRLDTKKDMGVDGLLQAQVMNFTEFIDKQEEDEADSPDESE